MLALLKRIDRNQIHAAFFAVIAAANAVDNIQYGTLFTLYGLAYVGVFVVASAVFFILHNKLSLKWTAGVMIFFMAMYLFMGDASSGDAAICAVFAIAAMPSRKLLVIVLSLLGVGATLKVGFMAQPAPQSIAYIALLGYFVVMFFELIWGKGVKLSAWMLDKEIIDIMRLVIKGERYKEIADRYETTESAIGKKLKRAREKVGARSNEELAIIMAENGRLGK